MSAVHPRHKNELRRSQEGQGQERPHHVPRERGKLYCFPGVAHAPNYFSRLLRVAPRSYGQIFVLVYLLFYMIYL